MRGMGDFQRAQTKRRDARVSAMAQHLRAAVELWEEIQLYPFEKEEPSEPQPASKPRSRILFHVEVSDGPSAFTGPAARRQTGEIEITNFFFDFST